MSPYEPRPEGLNTQPAPPSVVETLKPRTWHKGPPPHVGWWNASVEQNIHIWRWWDGMRWSDPVSDQNSEYAEGVQAPSISPYEYLEWTDYWPENARVPRINPDEVEA